MAAYRFAARVATGLVVDAGCGEGYGSDILAREARSVVSLDLDMPTLAHAASRYGSPAWAAADLQRLPLAAGSVDGIACLQVIEHLTDARGFLREARRTLRPEAPLVLTTPNRATFPSGLNPFHVHEYDALELRELLESEFTSVRLVGLVHGAPLRALERVLGEPIQARLVRIPYPELSPGLRAVLRTVTSRSFRLISEPERALDLVAVCRTAG